MLHGVAWEVDAVERVVGLGMYISREARRLQRSVAVLEQGFIALCTWKNFLVACRCPLFYDFLLPLYLELRHQRRR